MMTGRKMKISSEKSSEVGIVERVGLVGAKTRCD
jgi:hypothetical protein